MAETPKEKPEGLLIIIMNGTNESFLVVYTYWPCLQEKLNKRIFASKLNCNNS